MSDLEKLKAREKELSDERNAFPADGDFKDNEKLRAEHKKVREEIARAEDK